jgi:hypothetical protein
MSEGIFDEGLHEKVKQTVAAEIKAARARGEYWTPFREFINPTEIVGAARCHCRRPSKYVSYCTSFTGRVVLCEHHYKFELKAEGEYERKQ